MRYIQLTQGKYAKVDDKDYRFIMGFKWNAHKRGDGNYYARSSRFGAMHRLLLGVTGRWNHVDHKDGDALNNQRDNLRACSHGENMRNRKSSDNGTSKYLGVSWDKSKNRWVAQITIQGKCKKLGTFLTELDAAIVYNIACRKYHGEFANPNVL